MNHPGNKLKNIPPPPDSLSAGARREWESLAPIIFQLQTGRPADSHALELLCEILTDIRALQETVRAEGFTVDSSGGPKPHPGLRNLESARRHAQQLLEKFDLTPNRNKVWDSFPEEDDHD